ncbi:ATP-binding cassette domain-containing protein [Cryptosporangium phraense]|uniref:ABC transporter ATP-binding protein n=1 Tax=Cryptosporangium phraense TaxID=2593070 RepID=A0A545B0K0_9ACTN|nr:ABC transporter ATP-binding protein [Cryptosporangium phraense]TQS47107.1 ABC transporter ATP-binding protein [Cryptosporangium phraense]
MTAVLSVSGLSVRAGDRELVSDVSFSVDAGERLGLIGESGSGKSLTALAVLGLLPEGLTASGSVRLGSTEVIGASDRALTRVRGSSAAIVFQEPLTALDPLMRIGSQVAAPLKRFGSRRGRPAVLDALAEVKLDDPERIARAYPHQISGGQRQRVAIAMALACRPALLIADEPTTALDVTVQADVLTLLDGLVRDRGMGLLFISHDLAVVSKVTDRVVVLEHGVAVERGVLTDLLRAPQHPYTRSLVAAARTLDSALEWS